MFYSPAEAQTWGSASLVFHLPVADLRLQGLSPGQRDGLVGTYPGFVSRSPDSAAACRVYRLKDPPGLSLRALTRNGQYTPYKVRKHDAIELTGIDFESRIGVNDRVAFSSLGVVREHELAQAVVIENFLRVYTAHHAVYQGGVVLHSAGLVFDDRAFVFVGRSGAGKTTLTRKAHRDGARVLSDDINLLLPRGRGFRAFAVPFTGEFGRTLGRPDGRRSYPVAGVVLLERGVRLETRRVRSSEAIARLLVGCPFVNAGTTDESTALFDILGDLVNSVPVLGLTCRREDSIDHVVRAVTEVIENGCDGEAH